MTTQQLDVSVVICAYTEERWDDLLAAVDSVRRQTVQPKEIVIIIDHNQALLERACQHIPDAIVVENNGPLGISGARNTCVTAASGTLIAFLDDDAIAEPDWLEQHLACYADPKVVAVGGSIRPAWPHERPQWFPEEFDWVVGCTYPGLPTENAPVQRLISANMTVLREMISAVGGFRTEVGESGKNLMRGEDTEFCIRLGQRFPDRVLLYAPKAKVHHRVSLKRTTWDYYRARCYSEGVSKALMARFVGVGAGTAAERSYVSRVLPLSIVRTVRKGIHGDPNEIRRAGAILAGFSITLWGYLQGSLINRRTAVQ